MMETLNDLAHLRDSEFGRPSPRHGLRLLYWFAKDCVSFSNGNIRLSKCNPAKGDFGFHPLKNRPNDLVNKHILDLDRDYDCYVVGNLNVQKYPKAKKLPAYVSKDKSIHKHKSNKDRIIVSLSKERQFHGVYVTQHLDRFDYDPNATYQISRGLLKHIKDMSLEDFLEEMVLSPQTKSTVSQDATALSRDLDDIESETENSDYIPLINIGTSTKETSRNESKKKESCSECCIIL